ncbi:hypothetical protein DWU99_03580 [Dyella psychrodurans]|uniref:Uncharacterized protein n=1 Tax=Dyella psychrodurans TaxID=1927960 RepID=A0A370XD82_9GAMM|nr:hypothetical protein DWU99_03580 [Dyella psychrodurans]
MKTSDWLNHGWVLAIAFFFLAYCVVKGLRTGESSITYQTYKKSEDPGLYWIGIVINGVVALFALWLLFFR